VLFNLKLETRNSKLPSRPKTLTEALKPASLGYRMPAEWEPHAATWLAWPHNADDWPGRFEPIPWVYAEIVRHLARVERVCIIVNNAQAEAEAQKILASVGANLSQVSFHRWPTDRVWTRDSGPIFIRREGDPNARRLGRPAKRSEFGDLSCPLAITHWQFNAWAKYSNWQKDARLPTHIAALLELPAWQPTVVVKNEQYRIVLEGGSIDVNGHGTMLTTEECLLSAEQARNPGLDRRCLESVFADYLGIRKIIWLNCGIAGDDTHGHVDDIARFVGPNTVVAAVETNRKDPNFAPLAENLARLHAATDQEGCPLRVVELPMPEPIYYEGTRLPASYANFYIANNLVLVPVFNDANDRLALHIIATLLPQRKVVPIYCGDFIWGFGAIHCATQQQPK
jgi:agmatine deiminase